MLASLHVHRFPARRLLSALPRFNVHARRLAREPGVRNVKVLTHGGGDHVGMAADVTRLSVFVVWEDEASLDAALARGHRALRPVQASGTWQVRLRPLRTAGTWSGDPLFPDLPTTRTPRGPVVSVAFIQVKAARIARFWLRSLPGPGRQVMDAPGARHILWMVELPFRTGITVTVWEDLRSMTDFAYKSGGHAEMVREDGGSDFGEFFIGRFAPISSIGDLDGVDPLAGLEASPT